MDNTTQQQTTAAKNSKVKEAALHYSFVTDTPPDHLAHTPIYYSHWHDIEPENPSDVRFLSLGFAQYDSDDLSVKVFRHSGKRWSRQSEEIPLKRVFKMALFATAVVRDCLRTAMNKQSLPKEISLQGDAQEAAEMFGIHLQHQEKQQLYDKFLSTIANLGLNEIMPDMIALQTQLNDMSKAGLLDTEKDARRFGLFNGDLEETFFEPLPDEELKAWQQE